MKTLVVGDMHLKQPFVLPAIGELLAADGEIGRVVFCGDACDDWGAAEADELGAMKLYARWVAERRAEGLQVDVLLGNHDFCYVRGKRGPGSVMTAMRELRSILEDDVQARLACAVGPYVCTHAGLTNVWARRYMPDALDGGDMDGIAASIGRKGGDGVVAGSGSASFAAAANSPEARAMLIAGRLNEMLADSVNWEALDSCPPSRGGWSLPGPLWADLRDLIDDPLGGVPQIVGHTPVACAENYAAHRGPHGSEAVWACDTMSVTSYGMPIGDGSMLLVDESAAVEPVPFPGKRGFQDLCGEYWLKRG